MLKNLKPDTVLKADDKDVSQAFTEIMSGSISRQALINMLVDRFDVSRKTIIKRLKCVLENKEEKDKTSKIYTMSAEKSGREVFYSLLSQPKLFGNKQSNQTN